MYHLDPFFPVPHFYHFVGAALSGTSIGKLYSQESATGPDSYSKDIKIGPF